MGEQDFIVPPPGIVPSAPQPHAPDRTVRAVPRTLPTFAPGGPVIGAPGAPLPKPPARVGAPAPTSSTSAASDASSEEPSQPGPAPAGEHVAPAWRLVAASGFEVVIDGTAVLGRDPQPTAVPGARAIAVDDPARTVSKTHAFAEPTAAGLRVTDLRSTNGVRVEPPGEPMRELVPGEPTVVAPGAALYLGEFGLRVDGVARRR